MEAVIEWFTSGGWDSILTILAMVGSLLSTIFVKFVTNPEKKARVGKAELWFKRIMRWIGGGKYLDEEGNWSVPFLSVLPKE